MTVRVELIVQVDGCTQDILTITPSTTMEEVKKFVDRGVTFAPTDDRIPDRARIEVIEEWGLTSAQVAEAKELLGK